MRPIFVGSGKILTNYLNSFQALFEKLGKTSRTVDTELESQIENLRDTQRKYGNVLRLARALTSHFYHVIQTQVSTYALELTKVPLGLGFLCFKFPLNPKAEFAVVGTFFTNKFPSLRIFVTKKVGNGKN